MPWACLVGPGIVLNKDGSFQRTLRYRGPDLDSATEAELVSISARLNNVLKRFGAGWAFLRGRTDPGQPVSGRALADPASARRSGAPCRLQRRRCASREPVLSDFLYLPPPEHEGRAERLLYERSDDTSSKPSPMPSSNGS